MENINTGPKPEDFGLSEETAQYMLSKLQEQKKKFDKISLQISLAAAIIISIMFLISNLGSGVPVLVTVVMGLSTFTFALVAFGLFWKVSDRYVIKLHFPGLNIQSLRNFLLQSRNLRKIILSQQEIKGKRITAGKTLRLRISLIADTCNNPERRPASAFNLHRKGNYPGTFRWQFLKISNVFVHRQILIA